MPPPSSLTPGPPSVGSNSNSAFSMPSTPNSAAGSSLAQLEQMVMPRSGSVSKVVNGNSNGSSLSPPGSGPKQTAQQYSSAPYSAYPPGQVSGTTWQPPMNTHSLKTKAIDDPYGQFGSGYPPAAPPNNSSMTDLSSAKDMANSVPWAPYQSSYSSSASHVPPSAAPAQQRFEQQYGMTTGQQPDPSSGYGAMEQSAMQSMYDPYNIDNQVAADPGAMSYRSDSAAGPPMASDYDPYAANFDEFDAQAQGGKKKGKGRPEKEPKEPKEKKERKPRTPKTPTVPGAGRGRGRGRGAKALAAQQALGMPPSQMAPPDAPGALQPGGMMADFEDYGNFDPMSMYGNGGSVPAVAPMEGMYPPVAPPSMPLPGENGLLPPPPQSSFNSVGAPSAPSAVPQQAMMTGAPPPPSPGSLTMGGAHSNSNGPSSILSPYGAAPPMDGMKDGNSNHSANAYYAPPAPLPSMSQLSPPLKSMSQPGDGTLMEPIGAHTSMASPMSTHSAPTPQAPVHASPCDISAPPALKEPVGTMDPFHRPSDPQFHPSRPFEDYSMPPPPMPAAMAPPSTNSFNDIHDPALRPKELASDYNTSTYGPDAAYGSKMYENGDSDNYSSTVSAPPQQFEPLLEDYNQNYNNYDQAAPFDDSAAFPPPEKDKKEKKKRKSKKKKAEEEDEELLQQTHDSTAELALAGDDQPELPLDDEEKPKKAKKKRAKKPKKEEDAEVPPETTELDASMGDDWPLPGTEHSSMVDEQPCIKPKKKRSRPKKPKKEEEEVPEQAPEEEEASEPVLEEPYILQPPEEKKPKVKNKSPKKKLPKLGIKLKQSKKKRRGFGSDNENSDMEHTPPPSPAGELEDDSKRRSSRHTKRTRYNDTLDIDLSDEEFVQKPEEEKAVENVQLTEDTMVVEKILQHRTGKRELEFDDPPPEPVFIDVEEFYVKYKNLSYLHCDWKTEEELEQGDRRVGPKIKRYRQKKDTNMFDFLDDEPFNPDYLEVDRVLDVNEVEEMVEDVDEEELARLKAEEEAAEQARLEASRKAQKTTLEETAKQVEETPKVTLNGDIDRPAEEVKAEDNEDNKGNTDIKDNEDNKDNEAQPEVEKMEVDEKPEVKQESEVKEEPAEVKPKSPEAITEPEVAKEESEKAPEEAPKEAQSEAKEAQVTESAPVREKKWKKKISRHFLVKWRGLGYEDSTWELEDDIDPAKIEHFYRFRCPPPKSDWKIKKKPRPAEWKRMPQSPLYKNGNTIRDYQLEGVNWLMFCWHNQ